MRQQNNKRQTADKLNTLDSGIWVRSPTVSPWATFFRRSATSRPQRRRRGIFVEPKPKKTKSLTCLRHPLPSDGRGTKPRRGGIFFDNSPAFQGCDSSPGNIPSPVRDERSLQTATICGRPPSSLPSLAGLANSPDSLPSHKWLGYYRKMSLLTELDSFTLPFLQICQSYGLRRLRVLRATKKFKRQLPQTSDAK
jgi:hypothetical protein